VDADVPVDERHDADGEIVWSWRPKGWRQPGDDASHHARDGGNRQGSPGRSRISR